MFSGKVIWLILLGASHGKEVADDIVKCKAADET